MKKARPQRQLFGSTTATATAAKSGNEPTIAKLTKDTMKRVPKRLLSVLLAMMIAVGGIAVGYVAVGAAAKTKAQANGWIESMKAAGGYKGPNRQCVSLVKYYCNNFYGQPIKPINDGRITYLGVASQYPKTFKSYNYKTGLTYQVGDVISMRPGPSGGGAKYKSGSLKGTYIGHVGIVYKYNVKTQQIWYLDQWNSSSGKVNIRGPYKVSGKKIGKGIITGIARPVLSDNNTVAAGSKTSTPTLAKTSLHQCNTAVYLRAGAGGKRVKGDKKTTVNDTYWIDSQKTAVLRDSKSSDNNKSFTWGRIKGTNQWVALKYFTKITLKAVNETWIVQTKHAACESPGFTTKELTGKDLNVNKGDSKTIISKITVDGKIWGETKQNHWIEGSKCKLANGNAVKAQSIALQSFALQSVEDDLEQNEIMWITVPDVVYPEEEMTIEYSDLSANDYEVKVTRLNGEPDEYDDESGTLIYNAIGARKILSSSTLAKGDFSEALKIGYWYKIFVKANQGDGTNRQATAYFQVALNVPYAEVAGTGFTVGNTLKISWPATSGAKYSIQVQTLTNGLPADDEVEDGTDPDAQAAMEAGAVIATQSNITSTSYSFTIPLSAVGKYLKYSVTTTLGDATEDTWAYSPVTVTDAQRSYVVEFLNEYGDVIKAQTVLEGGSATPPANPVSDGIYNVFDGWSDSYEDVYDNLSLEPMYTEVLPGDDEKPITHIVVYDYLTNGGAELSSEDACVDVEEQAEIDLSLSATKDGNWNFVGWNTDPYATTALPALTMGNEDVTLFAIFSKTLTGTFVDPSGSRTASTTIFNTAETGFVDSPVLRAYMGYIPSGWTTLDTTEFDYLEEGGSPVEVADGTIYYAIYEKPVTLTYDPNGGTSTPEAETALQYMNSANTIALRDPYFELAGAIAKPGQVFNGWMINGITYDTEEFAQISSNTTAVAAWTTNIVNYTLTLNANGGSVTPTTVTQAYGSTYTLPTPTRSDYTFDGWTLSGGGSLSGSSYTFGTSNGTVTAQWAANPNPANKTALNNRISEIGNTQKGNFTDASWSTFQTALADAQAVENNASATQAQVDAALNTLNTAHSGLRENQPAKGIFGTNPRWYGAWWHYILFFIGFGFIWMWF